MKTWEKFLIFFVFLVGFGAYPLALIPQASADTGVTAEALLNGKTDSDTAQAYADLANEMLVSSGRPAIPFHLVTSTDSVDATAIPVVLVPDLLHNPAYGSSYTLAFRVGAQVRLALSKIQHEAKPDPQVLSLQRACYGGAMMRALGQVIGASPRAEIEMRKVNEFIRQNYGNEFAKVALKARDAGLADGPGACNVAFSYD